MHFILLLLCLVFCGSSSASLLNHPYNEIVLFGDSITQISFSPALTGLSTLLADTYQRKMDIVNRGFSGYNTSLALPILRELLPKKKEQRKQKAHIELMTIFFGANDAAFPSSSQNVPVDQYQANLKKMITMIQDKKSTYYNPTVRVVLINQPPLNDTMWKQKCEDEGIPLDRSAARAKVYAAAAKQVGEEMNVTTLDLWSKIMEQASGSFNGTGTFLMDGLHLNADGYSILYNMLMDTIQTKYPEIAPNNLKFVLGQ
ncbi:SGNH hydrolase-type esterase domain-containing protein [Chlamydoabsidia padenii]|nr:SGNH hydrolase-type esterase domain-containing protein [Chlamydoabsidia padenii]